MKKEVTPKCKGLKPKTSDEKRGKPQNARGSNQRPPMKKEATPKHKGFKPKTSDEKRGNSTMQGTQTKNLR
jgi:hypothetical protein